MTRLPRVRSRLGAVGVCAVLGLVTAVGTAAPAHADVHVDCASTHAVGTLVFGLVCSGATNQPQPGTVEDSTHLHRCAFVESSPLANGAMGNSCTLAA